MAALWRRYGWIFIGIGLLLAVYLLPPDTSLSEAQRRGALLACVPTARPPLVTGDAEAPGIEVELLAALAGELDLRLVLNTVPTLGQGLNPRSWGITRAQCAVIAGGIVDSPQTRAYLSPGPAYWQSGWSMISTAAGDTELTNRPVGVLATLSGTDRIALSAWLRSIGARAVVVRSADALAAGLADGTYDAAITGSMAADALAGPQGWSTRPLPPPLEPKPVVFGLWKGDLTLKRAIESAFARIVADGRLSAILSRYGIEDGQL